MADMTAEEKVPLRSRQLTLELPLAPGFGPEDFFVSGSNESAYAMVERWPAWPDPVLIIKGPRGSGKSHLGAIWAAKAGAGILPAASLGNAEIEALASSGPLLLEDLEALGPAQTQLFHLINLIRESGAALVLTAERPPDALGPRHRGSSVAPASCALRRNRRAGRRPDARCSRQASHRPATRRRHPRRRLCGPASRALTRRRAHLHRSAGPGGAGSQIPDYAADGGRCAARTFEGRRRRSHRDR
ncbi:protein of unknown function [Methylocella tundrae]|uniref:Chromosomal replication initiator protein DnaA domain-containing protein n=1 Tax=Methylocella tundrae TaxID=227605 RepID=A0A4U8YZZ6_METTU|nr:protein of unknown function [Methylocella tundrae]